MPPEEQCDESIPQHSYPIKVTESLTQLHADSPHHCLHIELRSVQIASRKKAWNLKEQLGGHFPVRLHLTEGWNLKGAKRAFIQHVRYFPLKHSSIESTPTTSTREENDMGKSNKRINKINKLFNSLSSARLKNNEHLGKAARNI